VIGRLKIILNLLKAGRIANPSHREVAFTGRLTESLGPTFDGNNDCRSRLFLSLGRELLLQIRQQLLEILSVTNRIKVNDL
jgi:hypothetical protein